MLRYKNTRTTSDGMIIQDVKINFNRNPTVRDYVNEIQLSMKNLDAISDYRDIWIYSNGIIIGYVTLAKNSPMSYRFNYNLEVWDALVAKCECTMNGSEHLYKIWLKENIDYDLVRPANLPKMFQKALALV